MPQADLPRPPLPSGDALPQDCRGSSGSPHGGWVAVASGWQSSAALARDGTLWSWGDNRLGMLGLDDVTHRLEPFPVSEGSRWLAVAAGIAHVLAIDDDGYLWAWGDALDGQLGLGPCARDLPTRPMLVPNGDAQEHVEDLAAIMTLNGYPVYRVGSGVFDSDWKAVAAGVRHSLAIKNDGSLWAWGANGSMQLGLGDRTDRYLPTRVGPDRDWAAVSAGSHSLAIKTDGSLWTWGSGEDGRLGLGADLFADVPTQVGGDRDWSTVCARVASVGLKQDGTLWTWGGNAYGQLGLGDRVARSQPTQVGHDDDWIAAATGFTESILAVKSGGSLWAWGRNECGELGLTEKVARDRPVRVPHVADCASVAVGGFFSLAIDRDGALWAWGRNDLAQLGLGEFSDTSAPARVIARGRGLPKATAKTDVVATSGGTATFPFSLEDRQRPTVRVTLVVRTVKLELLGRWRLGDKPTNVDLTESLPCDLPTGDHLWYVYAIGADGAKQPRSRTARLSVRPKGLLPKLTRGRPKPVSDDTDSAGEGGPPEVTLGREDD
ncbi:MAG TPA: hypothetical protein VIJ15_12895 [Dermatophilaceae bacterium]